MAEFLAETLTSRQLLALLYTCEIKRKGGAAEHAWGDFLAVFAPRLANLSEPMRLEVLSAHLMSVEDIDIYNDSLLCAILDENRNLIGDLSHKLDNDPRFAGATA